MLQVWLQLFVKHLIRIRPLSWLMYGRIEVRLKIEAAGILCGKCKLMALEVASNLPLIYCYRLGLSGGPFDFCRGEVVGQTILYLLKKRKMFTSCQKFGTLP